MANRQRDGRSGNSGGSDETFEDDESGGPVGERSGPRGSRETAAYALARTALRERLLGIKLSGGLSADKEVVIALMDGFLKGAISVEEYKLLDALGASKLIAISVAINDEIRQSLFGARGGAMAKTLSITEERAGGERTIIQRADVMSIPGPEKPGEDVSSIKDPVIIDVTVAQGSDTGTVSDLPSGPAPPLSPMDKLKALRGE